MHAEGGAAGNIALELTDIDTEERLVLPVWAATDEAEERNRSEVFRPNVSLGSTSQT